MGQLRINELMDRATQLQTELARVLEDLRLAVKERDDVRSHGNEESGALPFAPTAQGPG